MKETRRALTTGTNRGKNETKRASGKLLFAWFMAFTLIFGQVAAVSASIAAPSPSSAARLQNTSETSPAATDSAGVEPTANESDPEQTQTPDAATQAATAQAETPAAAPVIIGESETPTADAPLVIEEALTPGTETLTAEPTTPPQETAGPADPSSTPAPTATPIQPTATTGSEAGSGLQALESGIFTYELITGGVKITGFVDGQSSTDLSIPDFLEGQAVIEIAERAFMSAGITSLSLGANLQVIHPYAFTANSISSLSLPASLRSIGDYAFRDNLLTSLSTGSLQTLGNEAFANNRLTSLDLGSVQTIGNSVFINNLLSRVSVPDSVTSIGSQVFAYNDRYVILDSTNPLVKTELVPDGFGQVVNPVTVTVHLLDEETKAQIVADIVIGEDLSQPGSVILLNEENLFTPPSISGYIPSLSPVAFTPDSTSYELDVFYKSTATKPLIELVAEPKIAENGDGSEAVLLSFVKATDLFGNDISSAISVNPQSVDSSVPGPHEVVYTVSDALGNTATRTVSVLVGLDWMEFPLGNGWVLGDFIYDGNKVMGFSPSGLTKATTQKDLILPHINPHDGTTLIDTIGVNKDTPSSFRFKLLSSVADYADNIRTIEGRYSATSANDRDPGAFENTTTGTGISSIDLPNLEYVGRNAFYRNNLSTINFPKLSFLGAAAFGYNRITSVSLPMVQTVDVWGLGNNLLTELSMPSLRKIESAGFIYNDITSLYLPELVSLGGNDFAESALTEVTDAMIPKVTTIASGSFRNNAITSIFLPNLVEVQSRGFQYNKLTTLDASALPNLQIVAAQAFQYNSLTELSIPNLASVGTSAFNSNPGMPEYDNNVIIWTQNDEVPSKENYLINPKPGPYPPVWAESDFVWDAADPSRVLGFSSSGKQKLPLMEYKVVLPERAITVGRLAFTTQRIASVSGANVETIEPSAFYNNGITSIDFPQLRHAGDSSLQANKISTLNLPLLETVGVSAFEANQLTSLNLPSVTKIGNRGFIRNQISELTAPELLEVGHNAFENQPIVNLDLPKVTSIGNLAFSGSKLMKTANLPELITVGNSSFFNNVLSSVNMPKVETIGTSAFATNQLTLLELPMVKTIGAAAFRDNRITEAYLPLTLEPIPQDVFDLNRSKNTTRLEVMVFLPEGQNPKGLEDGYVNSVRQHIINPTKVTVSYIDENNNPLAESFSEYILAPKTYPAIQIFDYTPDKLSETVGDVRQPVSVVFKYTKIGLDGMQTQGVEIYQRNETNINTTLPKTRYYIGDMMITRVYLDLTGFDAIISNGKLRIYYDPAFIDESSIRIPGGTDLVTSVNNGVFEITLGEISGGYNLEVPIEWRFKKYVTPDNYRMEINALMVNGEEVYSVAEPIYLEGYYNKPYHTKRSPLNIPDYDYGVSTSATNGPRLMGEMNLVRLADDTYIYAVTVPYPVEYRFTFNNLERFVNKAIITETLPEYIAIDEAGNEVTLRAVFDPMLNPNWELSADGLTLTQVAVFAKTINPSSSIEPLYLSFPRLKSGHNVYNNSQIELFPDNQGINENTMHTQDDLSIYAVRYEPIKYDGDPRFDKDDHKRPWYDGNTAYFYDMQTDRDKVIPYFLRVSSMATLTDLVDLRITDYGLDQRLYYDGVSFPQAAGATGGLPVTVVAYAQAGATMNPNSDPILQSVAVNMSPTTRVSFDANIARSIDYIQIILPETHKVFYALEFVVETRLREPELAHFTTPPLSGANVFTNHAVMSGNLYLKGSTTDASVRTDPLLGPGGLVISQYDAAWDNIAGNYLWHEQAIVNIKDYSVDMGVGKTQTYSSTDYVYPGDEGSYNLRIRPFVAGGINEADGRAVVRETLLNFEMVDLLPNGLSVLEVTPTAGFRNSQEASYRIVDDYNGSGRTAIVFTATALDPGVFDIASIRTMVDPETPDGQVTNEVFLTFDNPTVRKVGTMQAPFGQENDGRVWVKDQTTFNLIKVKELFARKYIRKLGDLAWLSTGITTASEGPFEYRLSLINNLDTPRSKIEIVDFFPYPGDISIQEENIGSGIRPPRESEFTNSFDLTRPVIAPAGYSVYYWNSNAPINYGVASADAVIAGLAWSGSPAANTRAVRIVANDDTVVLNPGERLDVIIPMKAPVNTQANNFDLTGKKAWNTYVRKDNATIRFLEPNRVFNMLEAPLGSIEFTKWAQDTVVTDPPALQYPLAGAEFELRDKAGNFIAKVVTGPDGKVLFDNLPILNDYTIREIKAPAGFLPNTGSFTVTQQDFLDAYDPVDGSFAVVLTDAQSKETFLNIHPVYGSLTVQKLNGVGEGLAFIRFNLKGLDSWNQSYDRNHMTNNNGLLTVSNLLEGRYRLSEIELVTETGFVAIPPVEFEITADNREIRFVNEGTETDALVNSAVRVLITKLAVGNAFDITASLRDLTDFGRKKLDGYQFTITKVSDQTTTVTDATLNGFTVLENLEINTLYEITEVRKDGTIYQHNGQAYRFMINGQGKLVDETGVPFRQNQLNFPNPQKLMQGRIRVVKTDNANQPLAGAVFGLFKDGVKVFEGSTALVGSVAELTFEGLTPGTYVLKEISAPPGYAHSLTEYTFTVPSVPDESMLNNPHYLVLDELIVRQFEQGVRNIKLQVDVIKGDNLLTNIPLADAQAYVALNPEYRYRITGPNLACVYRPLENVGFTLYKLGDQNERIEMGSFTTNAEGQIDFQGFMFEESSRYELVETSTLPGYRLDQTPIRIDIGLEVLLEGFNGTISRFKNNEPIQGRIIISKYDEDDRVVLAGATFGLFAADDLNFERPLQTKLTDASGVIEFRGLPVGAYRVKELAVPAGFQLMEIVLNVTLDDLNPTAFYVVYNPQLVEFEVIKQWVFVPLDSATIWVTANGGDAYDIDGNKLEEVVLNDQNGWKAYFSRLPKYDKDGALIEYSIKEKTVDGYTDMVIGNPDAGFTVVNTEEQLTSIGVTKTWETEIGPNVTVYLLADGVRTGQSVILSTENRWQHVFTGLPSFDGNRRIIYTVEEAPVDGFIPNYSGTAEDGFVITNAYVPQSPEVSIDVKKTWVGPVGSMVTVHLLANGERTGKYLVLNDGNNWQGSFTGLPLNLNGVAIVYTVQEEVVPGYSQTYSGSAEAGFVITNTELPGTVYTTVPVRKLWSGGKEAQVWVHLLANGVRTGQSVILNDANSWQHTFTNLIESLDGKPIVYTVMEEAVAGYRAHYSGSASTGYTITNEKDPNATPIVKVPWTGDEGLPIWLAGLALGSGMVAILLNRLSRKRSKNKPE